MVWSACTALGALVPRHSDIWAGVGVRDVLKAGMDRVKNPSWKIHIHQGRRSERKRVCEQYVLL